MDSQWLKTQFKLHPAKTKAGLATAIGLEPPAISKILNGARQIKAQEYFMMREYFGLPNDGHNVVNPGNAYTLQPLDGGGTFWDADSPLADWVIPASIISTRTNAPPEKIRIYQVRETIMEPGFRQGEHVLVDLSDKHPSPPGVFVVSDGFGHMLRYCEFVPNSDPAEVRISAQSGQFQSQALKLGDFLIVGRVIAKLQML